MDLEPNLGVELGNSPSLPWLRKKADLYPSIFDILSRSRIDYGTSLFQTLQELQRAAFGAERGVV
jgi:hypothetical protein